MRHHRFKRGAVQSSPAKWPCPVCKGGEVAAGQLTCKPCWWRVPKELRNKVWKTWKRRRLVHTAEAIAAHDAAKREALAAADAAFLANFQPLLNELVEKRQMELKAEILGERGTVDAAGNMQQPIDERSPGGAICSCGGFGWVKDENWEPAWPRQKPQRWAGLIPCGFCNESGDGPEAAIEAGCMGFGKCHGPMVWCDWCGDTSKMCGDLDCDRHKSTNVGPI